MKPMRFLGAMIVAVGGLVVGASAFAADETVAGVGFGADNITFEHWCGDIQQYPEGRCEARNPEDVAAFNETRDRLQAIEIEHAKAERKDREFRKTFEAHDKIDRNRRFDF